jgi:DNA modification methylase
MGSLYRSQHELVFVFKKGTDPHLNNVELGKHGRYRTNIWSYPGVNAFSKNRSEELAFHPTVKPIQMIADAIMDVTQRGNIVLDGFLGSGTTLLAAEQTGRICFGIEYEPRYVDLAIRRWMEATGKAAVLVASGQTFAQLSALKRAYTQPLGKIDATYSGVNP